MLSAKNVVTSLVVFLSFLLGVTLGGINLYALISGEVRMNVLLFLLSILLVYLQAICLFILGITKDNKMHHTYSISAVVFGVTFFAVSQHILSAVLSIFVFWWMQQFIYTSSRKRSEIFIKFLPSEIFMPALRTTFIYLMIFFSLISFVQTRDKISQNTLVNNTLIAFVSKPFIPLFNKQLNSQVIRKLGPNYDNLPIDKKREAATAILREVARNMADTRTGRLYGIELNRIPFELVYVYDNGDVDIAPIVAGSYEPIKEQLYVLLATYGYVVPLLVALLIVLIIQPVFLLFGFVESGLTLLLFWILIESKILKVTEVDTKIERVTL